MLRRAFRISATALVTLSMLPNASGARSPMQESRSQAQESRLVAHASTRAYLTASHANRADPRAERLDPRVDRFRKQLEIDREALRIPGLSTVVLEDGKVLWTAGFGYADVEKKIPATPDTLYHVASLTKTFAAILTLQLVEKGRFSLDEEVSLYTPELQDSRVRIKHLLSHTSDGTPGERFGYNPGRFEYLKEILEKETGKSIRQLYVETFLEPLSMRDSMPGPDVADDDKTWAVLGAKNLARYREVLARFAKPYTYYGDGEIVPCSYPPRDFFVSAGLLSTARDMAKYDAAVDAHKFLGEALQARAWTPFASNDGKPLAHGLGWYVTEYRGMRIVWHYGHWGTGFSAMYLKIPAKRLTCIVLTNSEALSDHFFQMGENVTHNVIGCSFVNAFVPEVTNAVFHSSDASGDAKSGDSKSGDAKTGDAKTSAPASASATTRSSGAGSATAPPKSTTPESFTVPARNTDAYFAASTDCECTSRIALEKWIESRRAAGRKSIPIAAELAEAYVGSYQLPDRAITVTRDGNRLFIDSPEGDRFELFAETPTQFFLKIRQWTLTFVREAERVVRMDILEDGQILSAPKIR